jgi:hypothetical protein
MRMKDKKQHRTKNHSKNVKRTTVKSPAAKTTKPGTEAKRTIKQAVIEAITANKAITNDEMIKTVKAQFPKSAFKDTHAAWYRSQARKGLLTGTPIEIPAQARRQSKPN